MSVPFIAELSPVYCCLVLSLFCYFALLHLVQGLPLVTIFVTIFVTISVTILRCCIWSSCYHLSRSVSIGVHWSQTTQGRLEGGGSVQHNTVVTQTQTQHYGQKRKHNTLGVQAARYATLHNIFGQTFLYTSLKHAHMGFSSSLYV